MATDAELLDFGQRVRALRLAHDLTQEELAARAELSPTYIGYIENGHRNPSLKVVYQLARGLRVPPVDLLVAD